MTDPEKKAAGGLRQVNTNADESFVDVDFKHLEHNTEEVVIARLTEEDFFLLSQESLRLKSWTGFRLLVVLIIQGFNQAGYGVDWSVISGINAIKPFHSYLGVGTSGATFGTINALMLIGTFCGAPFVSLADVIGRRGVNFIGNFLVIVSAALQGFAVNLPMFMVGRFVLGFGSALMSTPQYMGEVAPAHLRGRYVGLFGACFQLGSIGMNAAMLGFVKITNDWSWRIPLLLEALCPVIVCVTIYIWTPESPRYLLMRGKHAEARKIIARYQTTEGDNVNHPLVNAVMQQMEESLSQSSQENKKSWDWRAFAKRGARYRILCLVLYSIFQQWNGGGIIGNYLTPALETVGITESSEILAIQFGSTVTYCVFTVAGSFIVDRFGRRTLIFAGLISFILLQTAATITSWQFSLHEKSVTASLTIFWIFLFQFCSSLLIATMHNLYPIEILSLALRAKGMGLYGLVQGAAGVVNTYGISVGINKIGYKIWVVYIVYNTIQLGLSYFIFPETHGLSLEEIDAVFETKGVRPVKMSMDIQKAKKEKARLEGEIGHSSGREL